MTDLLDECAHIARAVACLGDRHAKPVESPFFDQACRAAIKGKSDAVALDKHMRWHLALLDAGIPEAEAADIIADITAPEIERIAA